MVVDTPFPPLKPRKQDLICPPTTASAQAEWNHASGVSLRDIQTAISPLSRSQARSAPPRAGRRAGPHCGSGVAAPRRAGIDSPAAPGNDNSKRKRTEYITDEDPQTDHDGFRLEVGKRRLLRRVFFRCIGHGAGEPRHRFRFPGLRRIVFCGRSRSFVRHV